MLPVPARDYILAALDNTPATMAQLLSRLSNEDPAWDAHPNPDRFCLREIVAHIADWEEVFRGRFERTVTEQRPLILRPDPGTRAQERGYAQADPAGSLARFQERRSSLTAWLRTLPDEDWERVSTLDRMGDITPEILIALVLSHDSYHLRQVAEWLAQQTK